MQGHNFDEEGIIHTWRWNMSGWLTTANHLLIFLYICNANLQRWRS